MNRVYIERRTPRDEAMGALAADLTHHFYTRLMKGKIIVVAEEPFLLLRVARKHWLRLEEAVQRERSKTLKAGRIAELSGRLMRMKGVQFTSKPLGLATEADVFFLAPNECAQITTACHTVYVCCEPNRTDLPTIMTRMQEKGLLVLYER